MGLLILSVFVRFVTSLPGCPRIAIVRATHTDRTIWSEGRDPATESDRQGSRAKFPAVGQRVRNFLAGTATDCELQPTNLDDQGGAMEPHDDDALLTPSEVAAMFRVNPKTVTRWARAGKISAIRTLGGHRRFRASEIRQFLEQVEDSERI